VPVPEPFADRVHDVAALDHPVTGRVYRLLAERDELSRDETADTLGVARSVAAFHLDKLVEAGLALVRFARLSGRSGPGAGRTAKVYRRSERELSVSVPDRHYDLAGQLLADAIERSSAGGVSVAAALREAATEAGRAIGAEAVSEAGTRPTKAQRREAFLRVLERHGYEPQLRNGEIVLVNCPFHRLAEQHRDLVCGMNLDFITGIVDGAGNDRLTTRLDPEPGLCCVRLATK